jgi:hypothetical protein
MLDAGPCSVSSEVADCQVPSHAMMIRLGLAGQGRETDGICCDVDEGIGDKESWERGKRIAVQVWGTGLGAESIT